MTLPIQDSRRVTLLAVLTFSLLFESPARSESASNSDGSVSSKDVVGYSLIGSGGVLTWFGVFAGFAGRSLCEREQDDQSRRECFDRQKRDSKKFDDIWIGLIGAGLTGIGTGLWLVKSTREESMGAFVQCDGDTWSFAARTSF